jgi:hypothetical protein
MALVEREKELQGPAADLAEGRKGFEGLVLIPDTISEVSGRPVAGFRPDAQALRVLAAEAGIEVELAHPDDVEPGIYSEHDADWVLPLMLELTNGVTAGLVANYLQRRLDEWRGHNSGTPTARHREVISDGDSKIVRELEGPAPEVIDWLRSKEADGREG